MDKKKRCPRCKSIRLSERLSEKYCKRCGQRWTHKGIAIPSFDKRNLKKGVKIPKQEQLILLTD